MTNERAFVMGVALGVAGSLIPDIPSAVRDIQNGADHVHLIYISYALFFLVVLISVGEILGHE